MDGVGTAGEGGNAQKEPQGSQLAPLRLLVRLVNEDLITCNY